MKDKEYENGFYFLYTPTEQEPVLVHCYYSNDMKTQVFGFNTHDGGGAMPTWDLSDDSEAKKVMILEETGD